ncbi:hypothetical protein J3A83DRAFT_4378528 [Scleroderma citrinum]
MSNLSNYCSEDNQHKDIYASLLPMLNELSTPHILTPLCWTTPSCEQHCQPIHNTTIPPHKEAPLYLHVTPSQVCNTNTPRRNTTPAPPPTPQQPPRQPHHLCSSTPTIFLQSCHSSPKEDSDNSALTTPPTELSSPSVSINEFISYMQVFNNFESWAALGWQAPRDHECLQLLSKVFQDAERVGMRVSRRVLGEVTRQSLLSTDLVVTSQDVIDVMRTQAEMVLLTKETYRTLLLLSFNTFLNQSWGPLVDLSPLTSSSDSSFPLWP